MNTVVSQIIVDAYRESNITADTTVLTAGQVSQGLRLLNRVVAAVYGFDMGVLMADLSVGNNNVVEGSFDDLSEGDVVPLNRRLVFNLTAPRTVLLHPAPQDGSLLGYTDSGSSVFDVTFNGNGRKIEGSTTYNSLVSGSSRVWVYDSPSAQWNVITPLLDTDLFPFPPEFDDFFVISLALRLNPRHSTTLAPESALVYKSQKRKFEARYSQVIQVAAELALLLTPGVRNERGWPYSYWGNPTDVFNRGRF